MSKGKDKPPRRNMILCFRSKFTRKLNIKLLCKRFALKSLVFKLDHKMVVKFSPKDMQSKKKWPASFILQMKHFRPSLSDNQGTPALSRRLPTLSSAEIIMITNYRYLTCYQLSQGQEKKNPSFPLPHFPVCTQSDGSTNKKQSQDLCGGERVTHEPNLHMKMAH